MGGTANARCCAIDMAGRFAENVSFPGIFVERPGYGSWLPVSARIPKVRDTLPMQAAIDAATDMIFVTDDTPLAAGGPLIVYANAAMGREFGVDPAGLIGKSPSFAFGPRTDAAVVERIRTAMGAMEEAAGEFRAYRADGTSFWTDWRGRCVVDPDSQKHRWIAIGRNTDERRRSEDRLTILSTAIDNANDAVYVYGIRAADQQPRIRYVNPAGLRNSGYTEDELLNGASRRGPLTEAGLPELVLAEMTAGRSMNKRLRLYRKDGTSYWAGVHFQPIRDRSGGFSQWICIERDITADVEREEARSDLMAMIGHDLQNPLTSILGYSEMLLETMAAGGERDAVRQIRTAGRRLESLAFELLTISSMERNAYEPALAQVDVRALLDDVVAYMPEGARVTIAAPATVAVWSDAGVLRHTLENLLSNALKFSSAPAHVVVELTTPPGRLRVRVSDSGIGIPAADLPLVFNRATRGANVGERRGTGLGLSFVKRLVDSLGGSVSVKSVEGRGTTFDVQLPNVAPAPEPTPRA
jgi:PAS domain S-box-containing protein